MVDDVWAIEALLSGWERTEVLIVGRKQDEGNNRAVHGSVELGSADSREVSSGSVINAGKIPVSSTFELFVSGRLAGRPRGYFLRV